MTAAKIVARVIAYADVAAGSLLNTAKLGNSPPRGIAAELTV
jgi:hypothetical protein